MQGDTEYLCGHEFHVDCIQTWLLRSPTCPNCRANPYSQQLFRVDDGGVRSMIKDIKIRSQPQKADRVGPNGINGARHTPAALLTNYQRSVLRTFRELISDSDGQTLHLLAWLVARLQKADSCDHEAVVYECLAIVNCPLNNTLAKYFTSCGCGL